MTWWPPLTTFSYTRRGALSSETTIYLFSCEDVCKDVWWKLFSRVRCDVTSELARCVLRDTGERGDTRGVDRGRPSRVWPPTHPWGRSHQSRVEAHASGEPRSSLSVNPCAVVRLALGVDRSRCLGRYSCTVFYTPLCYFFAMHVIAYLSHTRCIRMTHHMHGHS